MSSHRQMQTGFRNPTASRLKNFVFVLMDISVCILNPQKMREQEDPSKTLWELWTPTEDDFKLINPQSPFYVGKLKHSIYYNLYRLYDSAQEVVDQWKAKQEGKKDIVTGMVLHSRCLLNVLKHHP
ncbi:hypothetical protein PAXRUDRAFT_18816 [Paxillus rubicundulus Ve08.2h10]|uniref:Uncharacterized protein n=1 Tax=Paxillus rubicundulus Ve08.2h10 TaxID=930991 RepID=A0A0D0CWZ4_9AGAM|nr:hypothetical protein PAXRUDRAFT_18816 [Paxillus rubicundulus Ve08.2h10]